MIQFELVDFGVLEIWWHFLNDDEGLIIYQKEVHATKAPGIAKKFLGPV
jgi:hypothetical protein